MMNFLFGTVAGGIVACIVTIAAARDPGVQAKLGLVPPALAAPAQPPSRCPAPPRHADATGEIGGMGTGGLGTGSMGIGRPELLFSRKRFWNVAP